MPGCPAPRPALPGSADAPSLTLADALTAPAAQLPGFSARLCSPLWLTASAPSPRRCWADPRSGRGGCPCHLHAAALLQGRRAMLVPLDPGVLCRSCGGFAVPAAGGECWRLPRFTLGHPGTVLAGGAQAEADRGQV